jgi:hypothetical protein
MSSEDSKSGKTPPEPKAKSYKTDQKDLYIVEVQMMINTPPNALSNHDLEKLMEVFLNKMCSQMEKVGLEPSYSKAKVTKI